MPRGSPPPISNPASHMESEILTRKASSWLTYKFLLVLGLGLTIRIFTFHYSFIINPDGVLYIHQARAMYFGQLESLTGCSLGYLSIYPFSIAGAYALFHDWLFAAKFVSLLFGTLTLVPLYFLLRRFFDDNISLLSTLVFAFIPVFVTKSADVVRGPIFWFFLTLSLYLFLGHAEHRKYRLDLLLSGLFCLLAAWARIEGLLFIFVTVFYLLCFSRERRFQKTFYYTIPILVTIFFYLLGVSFFNVPLQDFFRLEDIWGKISGLFTDYHSLRAGLSQLSNRTEMGVLEQFVHHARHLVWFIAFGTLITFVVRSFFYPFFFLFLMGVLRLRSVLSRDKRFLYLLMLSSIALVFLYIHILQSWTMHTRFMALFLLPSFIFVGFGLEWSLQFLKKRTRKKSQTAYVVVFLFILAFGLGKNLKAREADKIVFKKIGEQIASTEANEHVIQIASSLHTIRWISFYANLKYPGAPCPQENYDLKGMALDGYRAFVERLKSDGIKYFLWEERHWPRECFDFFEQAGPNTFMEQGQWNHPDTGKMILFKVI